MSSSEYELDPHAPDGPDNQEETLRLRAEANAAVERVRQEASKRAQEIIYEAHKEAQARSREASFSVKAAEPS